MNRDAFHGKTGRLTGYEYQLRVKEEKPSFIKPYPISLNYREKVRDEIKKLLEWNIIRKSTSQYVSPICVSIKKDQSIRLCLDARRLNELLLEDYASPGSIDELLQQCQGVKVMSSLDMSNSLYQIP